jgi:hypothetical protein
LVLDRPPGDTAVYGAHFLGHPEQVRKQVQRVGAEVYGHAASAMV